MVYQFPIRPKSVHYLRQLPRLWTDRRAVWVRATARRKTRSDGSIRVGVNNFDFGHSVTLIVGGGVRSPENLRQLENSGLLTQFLEQTSTFWQFLETH
jgi:hypothetical protein